jgi:hypothetical protein
MIEAKKSFALVSFEKPNSLAMPIVHSVANAMFSLLKLLIYEPYLLCLSRLECQA